MPEYRVVWEVELDANSPEEAAKMAQAMQRDPTSWATVFDVTGPCVIDGLFTERFDLPAVERPAGLSDEEYDIFSDLCFSLKAQLYSTTPKVEAAVMKLFSAGTGVLEEYNKPGGRDPMVVRQVVLAMLEDASDRCHPQGRHRARAFNSEVKHYYTFL